MTFAQQQGLIAHAMRVRAEAVAPLAATVGTVILSPLRALYRAGQTARARAELHALSDRMLKDIGLSRSEIESLFR